MQRLEEERPEGHGLGAGDVNMRGILKRLRDYSGDVVDILVFLFGDS